MPLLPVILILGGGAALLIFALSSSERPVPVHEPDLSPVPGSTRYKKVDAILGLLQQASASSGVPLGVLVGWIARESGGRLDEVTKLDERGYFQLMPSESKMLGVDHQRLSTDPVYSINAGLALIGHYMGEADKLGIAQHGSNFFWKVVKLLHTMGSGAVTKIVAAAKVDGAVGSWESLEEYATTHDSEFLHQTKHSPLKWFPLVDEVYAAGAPFGFGAATTVVGGAAFPDIIDPLDCLT